MQWDRQTLARRRRGPPWTSHTEQRSSRANRRLNRRKGSAARVILRSVGGRRGPLSGETPSGRARPVPRGLAGRPGAARPGGGRLARSSTRKKPEHVHELQPDSSLTRGFIVPKARTRQADGDLLHPYSIATGFLPRSAETLGPCATAGALRERRALARGDPETSAYVDLRGGGNRARMSSVSSLTDRVVLPRWPPSCRAVCARVGLGRARVGSSSGWVSMTSVAPGAAGPWRLLPTGIATGGALARRLLPTGGPRPARAQAGGAQAGAGSASVGPRGRGFRGEAGAAARG